MMSYLHLPQTHWLVVVEAVTLWSWQDSRDSICLSSSAGSGRNAEAPRVVCVPWGLDLGLVVTKRYPVQKHWCPWSKNSRFVCFGTVSETPLDH
jgi:hypothetical protein